MRDGSGDEVVLQLSGELDLAAVGALDDAAADVAADAWITLDLAGLTFIDSAGLRALMNLDLRARGAGRTVKLRSPQRQVLRLLQLCGFDDRFEITDT